MHKIKIGHSTLKAQGLFASQAISTEDTLYTADGLTIAAINTAELSNFCYCCYAGSRPSTSQWYSIGQHRDAELKVCTGCHVAHFCSVRCQKQAWKKYHKYECKVFKKLMPRVLPEQVRAVMTILLQRDNGLLDDGVWENVVSAISHVDNLKAAGGDAWISLMLMAKATHEYSQTNVDLDTVLKLICILKVNGLQLSTTYGDTIGVFLDLALIKINHNCDGNVMVHRPTYTNATGWPHRQLQDKTMLKLLPLRNIAEGEELTMSYVDFTDHVSKRQKYLQKNYFFTCTCDKCALDTAVAKNLLSTDPQQAKQQAGWREVVDTHLQSLRTGLHGISTITALTKVIEAMESQPTFSSAIDPYPHAIHELKLLHLDSHRSVDKALVCALKEHFFVGSAICTSPFYPLRIVNAIYILQVFALLDDAFVPSQGQHPKIVEQAKTIEARGLSRISIKYWRLHICVDTRTRLRQSGLTDLLNVLEMEQMNIEASNRDIPQELLDSAEVKRKSEEEMRKLLGLNGERWDILLELGWTEYKPMYPNS